MAVTVSFCQCLNDLAGALREPRETGLIVQCDEPGRLPLLVQSANKWNFVGENCPQTCPR
jgi:hypothetical protein